MFGANASRIDYVVIEELSRFSFSEVVEEDTSPLAEDVILPSINDLPFLAPEVVLPTAEELFAHRFELVCRSRAEDLDNPPEYDELLNAYWERRRIAALLPSRPQNQASSSLPTTASAPEAGPSSLQTRTCTPQRRTSDMSSKATTEERAPRPGMERLNTSAVRCNAPLQDASPISPTMHLPGSETQLQDAPSTLAAEKDAANLATERRDTSAARRVTKVQGESSELPVKHGPASEKPSPKTSPTASLSKHAQAAEGGFEGSPKELRRTRPQRRMAIEAITTLAEAPSPSPLPASSPSKRQRTAEESCEAPPKRPRRKRIPTWKVIESEATSSRQPNMISTSNLLSSASLTDETTTSRRSSITATDTVLTTPSTIAEALNDSPPRIREPKATQESGTSTARKPTRVSKASSSNVRKRAAPKPGPSNTRKPKAVPKPDAAVARQHPDPSVIGSERLGKEVDANTLPTGVMNTGAAASKGKGRLVDAAEQEPRI